MTEGTYPRWQVFEALPNVKDSNIHVHYMRDRLTSFGFVEQNTRSGDAEFTVTCNAGRDVRGVPVPDLGAGMTMIEWLHNERKETT